MHFETCHYRDTVTSIRPSHILCFNCFGKQIKNNDYFSPTVKVTQNANRTTNDVISCEKLLVVLGKWPKCMNFNYHSARLHPPVQCRTPPLPRAPPRRWQSCWRWRTSGKGPEPRGWMAPCNTSPSYTLGLLWPRKHPCSPYAELHIKNLFCLFLYLVNFPSKRRINVSSSFHR